MPVKAGDCCTSAAAGCAGPAADSATECLSRGPLASLRLHRESSASRHRRLHRRHRPNRRCRSPNNHSHARSRLRAHSRGARACPVLFGMIHEQWDRNSAWYRPYDCILRAENGQRHNCGNLKDSLYFKQETRATRQPHHAAHDSARQNPLSQHLHHLQESFDKLHRLEEIGLREVHVSYQWKEFPLPSLPDHIDVVIGMQSGNINMTFSS